MSTIITRVGKGTPLTNTEVDSNFTNLNTDKIEKTSLSVAIAAASGGGNLTYSNTTGQFSFSPADLASYLQTESDTLNSVTVRGNTTTNAITVGDLTSDSLQLNLSATETSAVGKMIWNVDSGSYSFGLVGGNVESILGQTVHVYVTNAEPVGISKGQVVYEFGALGDRPTVKLAVNTGDPTSAKTMGFAAEDIAAGQTGYVITNGLLRGLNTSAFTIGDTVYLANTAGAITTVKPQAPNHMVYVGVVARVNSGSGIIYVKVQNGYELDEIHDVQIISKANNDIIQYNSASGLWKNINLNTAIGQALTTTSNVQFANINSTGNVQIDGNLTVSGTTVTINTSNLAVEDNMIYLNNGSTTANPDLGFVGNYNDGTYAHSGFFRDATDGRWKVFDSYTPEPDASAFIDTSHVSFSLADIQADVFYGSLSGNASTATILQTTRTISLTGDVTGSVTFNGSADATITTTIAANSVALGTDTVGDYVATVAASGVGISVSGSGSETAAITITSNATDTNTGSTIVSRNAAGNFSANVITANLTGTATNASQAANASVADSVSLYATDTTNAIHYPVFVDATTGNEQIRTDSGFTYNPATGTLTATAFSGSVVGAGTVTSVAVSGGTTGLTTSGGPITSSGTITLAGTLEVANGGTGITSLGAGIATFLGTPSSANLAAAVTGGTGSGGLVFADNATLGNPTLHNGYTEEVFAVTGTTPALSPTNGSIQTWTLTASSTPTAGTWASGQSITLMINDGTAYAITWTSLPVTWKTDNGTAPLLNTTEYTVIQLWKVATIIYGARVGNA